MAEHPIVRRYGDAAALVAAADHRVATALALASTDPMRRRETLAEFPDSDQRRLYALHVAALAVVELCMRGYRIGWDSATAAAAVYLVEAVGHPIVGHEGTAYGDANLARYGRELALDLIYDGHAEPWPFTYQFHETPPQHRTDHH